MLFISLSSTHIGKDRQGNLTLSLFSFLLIITAEICWSMKIRITATTAGRDAAIIVHQGLAELYGLVNHGLVGSEG